MSGLVEDAGLRKIVSLTDGEVVGVVRGRDFDGSRAELGFSPVVCEDGDFAVGTGWETSRGADAGYGDEDFFADEGGVARVGAGFTATAVSPSMVSGRVVATVMEPDPSASG